MKLERKVFPGGSFKAVDAPQGVAEMIVSVFFNTDQMDEIVMPGFFAESLANRRTPDGRPRAKGVWSHDWMSPIAITLDAKELLPGDPLLPPHLMSNGGLWVKGQFNLDTQRGREAFSDLSFGTIDEFSIGYRVNEFAWDNTTGVRKLIKGDWYEWSPVLVGANDQTALLGVKSAYTEHAQSVIETVQDFIDRSHERHGARVKEGRTLSQANRDRLSTLREQLSTVIADIDELLAATEPAKGATVTLPDPRTLLSLRARAVSLSMTIH